MAGYLDGCGDVILSHGPKHAGCEGKISYLGGHQYSTTVPVTVAAFRGALLRGVAAPAAVRGAAAFRGAFALGGGGGGGGAAAVASSSGVLGTSATGSPARSGSGGGAAAPEGSGASLSVDMGLLSARDAE